MTGQIWNTSEGQRSHNFSGPVFQYFTILMKNNSNKKKSYHSTPPKTQSSSVCVFSDHTDLFLPSFLTLWKPLLTFIDLASSKVIWEGNIKISCIKFAPCLGAKSVATQQQTVCGRSKAFYLLGKYPLNPRSLWEFAALLPQANSISWTAIPISGLFIWVQRGEAKLYCFEEADGNPCFPAFKGIASDSHFSPFFFYSARGVGEWFRVLLTHQHL